jgi:tRNA G46 methylase TrmB
MEQVNAFIGDSGRPLILDSFCGTGHSTRSLARAHPDALVLGIDKSAERLRRGTAPTPDNALLLRAECGELWRLLLQAGLRPSRHCLLYPNPWPKSAHLQRRIHGDPGFRTLLALGGAVELRSNWQVYVEEFGVALQIAGVPAVVRRLRVDQPLTLFEAKYHDSGHALWQLQADLTDHDEWPTMG